MYKEFVEGNMPDAEGQQVLTRMENYQRSIKRRLIEKKIDEIRDAALALVGGQQ